MKITLLGSGDTIGTPIPACECITCQDTNQKSARTRFGMLIEEGDEKILFDTNPDLHWQCVRHKLRLETIGNVFITHTHSDHLNGMGEFCVRRPSPTVVHYGNNPITIRNIEYFRYLEWEKVMSFKSYETNEKIIIGEKLHVTPIVLN
ncbi:MAG: MBL fold metallo-hydrolase, partial [Candidatus Gracilibacteria bacterium]|nr:MBL fold metallo-hydrolase [Candidatus Gracilibacteria bacterium]